MAIGGLKGANVEDTEGRSYPVRKVLAVAAGSADVEINEELIPGSGRREQQVRALRKYSEQLKQEMATTQGSMTLVRVRMFLNSRPQFNDTAELYRLPKAGRFIKFLRLFGYTITGSGPGMTVRAPRAPPVAGGGRPAGSVDLAPRMPRRGLAAGTAITWQPDNPYRGGYSIIHEVRSVQKRLHRGRGAKPGGYPPGH